MLLLLLVTAGWQRLGAPAAAPSEGAEARGMRPGGSINGNIGRYYDSLFTVEKHRMHAKEVIRLWIGLGLGLAGQPDPKPNPKPSPNPKSLTL